MSGSGSGDTIISVGGITVTIAPAVDVFFAQQIQDISLCAVILQMATLISNGDASSSIQYAATMALGTEGTQLAQDTKSSPATSKAKD